MSIGFSKSKLTSILAISILLTAGFVCEWSSHKPNLPTVSPSRKVATIENKKTFSKLSSYFDVTIEQVSLDGDSFTLKGQIDTRTDADQLTLTWTPFKNATLTESATQTFYDVKAGETLTVSVSGRRNDASDFVVHLAAETQLGGVKFGAVASFSSEKDEARKAAAADEKLSTQESEPNRPNTEAQKVMQ